jgi:hypothetical protein
MDHNSALSLLPQNVKLIPYDSLKPNQEYCIFRNDPCCPGENERKCKGTFIKNENLVEINEVVSRFDNFGINTSSKLFNYYPAINPIDKFTTQKFYFFEKRNLPSMEEKRMLQEMYWFMIKKIFLEPKFRTEILGPGLEFIGSVNINALKPHFFKN